MSLMFLPLALLLIAIGTGLGVWALVRRSTSDIGIVAMVVLLIGLLGVVISATGFAGPGRSSMGRMMDGMPGMMGGGGRGGMMDGRTERDAPPPRAGADQIAVVGDEFSFRPDEIRVRAGEPVNLVFRNGGGLFHTFTVEELDVDLRAAPGEGASGGLEGAEPGRYTVVCTVGGHAEAGMRGVLVVEDDAP